MNAERQSHWERVYAGKDETQVSWFQEIPTLSLELIKRAGATSHAPVIDIGGGASRLIDHLLALGYDHVSVLDVASGALEVARARLSDKASKVNWIVADVTVWEAPARAYDVWHDRAALHFLTDECDQLAYADRLRRALRAGGHAIIGGFAPDGPETCSGLRVARHDGESLAALLGPNFERVDHRRYVHSTPWGAAQKFQFTVFRFLGP